MIHPDIVEANLHNEALRNEIDLAHASLYRDVILDKKLSSQNKFDRLKELDDKGPLFEKTCASRTCGCPAPNDLVTYANLDAFTMYCLDATCTTGPLGTIDYVCDLNKSPEIAALNHANFLRGGREFVWLASKQDIQSILGLTNNGDSIRDVLGLVHHIANVTLLELSLPVSFHTELFRPTFINGCDGEVFCVWRFSPSHHGFTWNLITSTHGCPEYIAEPIPNNKSILPKLLSTNEFTPMVDVNVIVSMLESDNDA